MTLRLRSAFLIGVLIVTVWFLYISRQILTPFVLAAIFAYVFNPIVNLFFHKIRLPRTLSIIIIYVTIISLIGYAGTMIVSRLISESEELATASIAFLENTQEQIGLLPPFLQSVILEPIKSFQTTIVKPEAVWPFFSGALSGFISIVIFLFSAFYFLKEGEKTFDRLVVFLPKDYRVDIDILIRKINIVLGKYLRGQLFLVFLMATISFTGLSIMGVKFSLLLAVFIGLAEIVPVFGPLTAGTVASLFAVFDGTSRFGIAPPYEGLTVALGYLALNQIENILIVPHLMGKITKLHPLIMLFSALAGGHLLGILGLIVAVPAVATLKILLEFSLDKINARSSMLTTKKA